MRIGILTSSRADYGIYLPLLKELQKDDFFEFSIISFGTHLSIFHGYTIQEIINDGFEVTYKIESVLANDSPNSISTGMALTSLKFAEFWNQHKNDFDIVFCLGDRYEMFAAVTASIPYGITFAHLHGGETSTGAIDNTFRHAISLASKYHFVATQTYAKRVKQITGASEGICVVGALGLDNINTVELYSVEEFNEIWSIDLSIPTVLVTVHPETVRYQENEFYAIEICKSLLELSKTWQIVITMPNADTMGNVYRKTFENQLASSKMIKMVENFGTRGYFTCMKYAKILLGNTSSGIIEAASFNKFVINLGSRQQGRERSQNVIDCPIDKKLIIDSVESLGKQGEYYGGNKYYFGGATKRIVNYLKQNVSLQ